MSDHMPPTVGPASDEHRAVCVYSPRPGDPQCDRPATLHVRTDTDEYRQVALSTCDRHAPIARVAGRFVAEHEHALLCGLPGTLWAEVENVCVLDDTGEEPALAGRGVLEVSRG